MGRDFQFSIDRGGTFTDVTCSIASEHGGPRYRVLKVGSVCGSYGICIFVIAFDLQAEARSSVQLLTASCCARGDLVPQLLSEDPANYRDAPTEGIRRILEQGARSTVTPKASAAVAPTLTRGRSRTDFLQRPASRTFAPCH